MFAVRPGAIGDISLKSEETSNAYVAWFLPKASAYIPSPLAYRNQLYVVYDNGICAAFDSRSGTQIYKARIGTGASFSSSPWASDGKVFCLSEDGDTYVTGRRFYEQRIAVGVAVSASPVAADGKVYCAAEEGDVFVIRAGPVFEVLSRNRMGEPCMATPAMVPGRMFIRTVNSLVAVGKQKRAESQALTPTSIQAGLGPGRVATSNHGAWGG